LETHRGEGRLERSLDEEVERDLGSDEEGYYDRLFGSSRNLESRTSNYSLGHILGSTSFLVAEPVASASTLPIMNVLSHAKAKGKIWR
jgi:hypothetical protein